MFKSKRPSSLPQDVFTHLLSIVMLYVSVVSLFVLLFEYINALFPDPLLYILGADAGTVHGATAALFIAFPVFVFTSWLILRGIQSFPEKSHLWVRRWLLSLTLFVASVTIIVDSIVLIHNFLDGDLTARFLLKVLVIFGVAAAVFAYELWDLRREDFRTSRLPKKVAWAASVAVTLSIVIGFAVVGSPFYQRSLRFDERRVNDLQAIQNELISFWTYKNALPGNLDDLHNSISGFVPPTDPETHAAYEYRVKGPHDFELCSTFVTKSVPHSAQPYGGSDQNWEHDIGRTCFKRSIDPALYRTKPPLVNP